MKKIFTLFAVCAFALTFVACGQKAENTASETEVDLDSAVEAQPEVYDSAAVEELPTDSATVAQ